VIICLIILNAWVTSTHKIKAAQGSRFGDRLHTWQAARSHECSGWFPPVFIFRDAPGRSPALCSHSGGDEVGGDGCVDRAGAWMGRVHGWDGCVDGTGAWVLVFGIRGSSGFGGILASPGQPGSGLASSARLGGLGMRKPHACLC